MKKTAFSSWTRVLPSLLIPICLGMSLYLAVMILLDTGRISNELIVRYLTGHPVSKITLALFCIGVAGLGVIARDVIGQFFSLSSIRLTDGVRSRDDRSQDSTESAASRLADRLQAHLAGYPPAKHQHFLWRRLAHAVQFVKRQGDARGLNDELKYQAEVDQELQQQRYSLVRILIWATPMLGFLGTVLGISQALGGIQVGPENDFQSMMGGLRSSLYVAFDTTALALTLSMILMFLMFFVDRFEVQLLQAVDERAADQVAQCFRDEGASNSDSQDLERIGRTLLASTRELVHQQSELWQATIHSAQVAWKASLTDANQAVAENLQAAIIHAVTELKTQIGKNIQEADASLTRRWNQWQVLLSDNARKISANQSELARQTETLGQVLDNLRVLSEKQLAAQRPAETLEATRQLESTLVQLVQAIDRIPRARNLASQPTETKPTLKVHSPVELGQPDRRERQNEGEGSHPIPSKTLKKAG